MLLPSSIPVTESISGSVVPLAMFLVVGVPMFGEGGRGQAGYDKIPSLAEIFFAIFVFFFIKLSFRPQISKLGKL